MIELGYWASFVSGVVLLIMSVIGIRAFWWRAFHGQRRASRVLAGAILTGFAAVAANTLYWQVFGQFAISLGWIDVVSLRFYGSFLDIAFKLGPALAIYLHLKALRTALPPDEQRQWSVLGMAFYPSQTGLFSRIMNGMRK